MFSRDKHRADGNAPTAVDAEATHTAELETLTDQLLDTLAGMLRAYGSHGFDIETMEAAELERRCKAWARHILTGTPAPLEDEEPGEQGKVEPVAMDQRQWADLMAVREKVNLNALTQLHNRGAFDEVLARQIDFSFLSGQPVALLMLDLDNFKMINDTYGHPAGDLVLQTVANAIVRVFPRRSDFIARYGGEEFAVILVDVKSSDLAALGERVLEAVRNLSIDYQDNNIQLTCSAGIAACTPEDTAETLLIRSDQALYMAKQTGRDRTVFAGE